MVNECHSSKGTQRVSLELGDGDAMHGERRRGKAGGSWTVEDIDTTCWGLIRSPIQSSGRSPIRPVFGILTVVDSMLSGRKRT